MGMVMGWGKFYGDEVGMGLIFLPCHSVHPENARFRKWRHFFVIACLSLR